MENRYSQQYRFCYEEGYLQQAGGNIVYAHRMRGKPDSSAFPPYVWYGSIIAYKAAFVQYEKTIVIDKREL